LVTETWRLDLERTAFIELHCWNVGVPGGLQVPEDYWVFMGSPANHGRMAGIVVEVIQPCLRAARAAGMPTVHVQPEGVAARYPALRPQWSPTASRPASPAPPPVSNHAPERAERVHGAGYLQWAGWENLDLAPCLAPTPADVVVASTAEFDAWLREREVTTLIYTGFAANLCILSSPAAMAAMNGLGYRCALLREATLAIEFPDQPERLHTEATLRYVEAWVGYTASAGDFLAGLAAAD